MNDVLVEFPGICDSVPHAPGVLPFDHHAGHKAVMSMRFSIIGDIIAEYHTDTISPGGSAAIALALAELGGRVTLRSVIGTDDAGTSVLTRLKQARIHPGQIDRDDDQPTRTLIRGDDGTMLSSTPGAGIRRGAVMDIYELFGHDAMVLDTHDQPLRRFISDLPAHTNGAVRMVSTLRHLDVADPTNDEFEIALRFDAIVGTTAQYRALTGQDIATEALADIFDLMPGAHLRASVAITPDGLEVVTREERVLRPIQNAIPDVLLPRTVAAVAWGFTHHLDWDAITTIAVDADSV